MLVTCQTEIADESLGAPHMPQLHRGILKVCESLLINTDDMVGQLSGYIARRSRRTFNGVKTVRMMTGGGSSSGESSLVCVLESAILRIDSTYHMKEERQRTCSRSEGRGRGCGEKSRPISHFRHGHPSFAEQMMRSDQSIIDKKSSHFRSRRIAPSIPLATCDINSFGEDGRPEATINVASSRTGRLSQRQTISRGTPLSPNIN